MKETPQTALGNRIVEVLSKSGKEKYNYKQIAAKVGIFDRKGRDTVKQIISDFVDAKILFHAGRGKYSINPKYLTKENTGRIMSSASLASAKTAPLM